MTQSPVAAPLQPSPIYSPAEYINRLLSGGTLLPDNPENLKEVVGVLDTYGVVLDAYSKNLNYIADTQFLVLVPIFKYFNGNVTPKRIAQHLWHDRINYEYAEYVMRTMMWHGGGGLDTYLDSEEFWACCAPAVQAKARFNPVLGTLGRIFPEYLAEQVRQLAYYSGLGQFWRVMSDIFQHLANEYNAGNITAVPQVVELIKQGLVDSASKPITYSVKIRGTVYDIIPEVGRHHLFVRHGRTLRRVYFLSRHPFLRHRFLQRAGAPSADRSKSVWLWRTLRRSAADWWRRHSAHAANAGYASLRAGLPARNVSRHQARPRRHSRSAFTELSKVHVLRN